ncbi:hypothetical protein [Cohnella soli]|uniref:Uncharacterized protein n=1 Tax=Cohnella soli TaxID=425005 RepID=A0ABW0HMR3_9BACL
MYDLDARSTLRAFIRKLRKDGQLTTANGKANLYAGQTQIALHLKTHTSRRPITLRYAIIRAALQLAYYTRTVTRKDLEVYTRGANSALLGVLIEIFGDRGKLQRTTGGLIRLSLRGVRYFFAGADRVKRDLDIAAANGARFVLMSYAHIRRRHSWKGHVQRLGLKVLLDSGAFTHWQAERNGKQLEPIVLEEYAAFIMEHQDVLHGYFNLDKIGDPAVSRENANRLKAFGLQPIEVWHVGGSIKALKSLVEEDHAVIAIGGSVGLSEKKRARAFRWIFRVFKNQNFHFLGGSSKLLQEFPWFSADSTGWSVGRKYGAIIDECGQRKAPIDMDPLEALAYNARYFAGLEAA